MTNRQVFERMVLGLETASYIYDVDTKLLLALFYSESRYDFEYHRRGDGIGLGQVMVEYWAESEIISNGVLIHKLTDSSELRDPYINVLYSAMILNYYINKNNGNTMKGLYEYNGGQYDSFPNRSGTYQQRKTKYLMEIMDNYNFLITKE